MRWYAICLMLVLASPALADESAYTWRTRDDDPDRVYLYHDGKQIGGWSYSGKYYRSFDGENWGPRSNRSPVPPPERSAVNVTMPRQSPTLLPLRGLKVRMGTFLGQIMLAEFEQMTPLIAQAVADAAKDGVRQLAEDLFRRRYLIDLHLSAKLFAHIEMGGKLGDKSDGDGYRLAQDLLASGSARLFLSERAKFGEKLKAEGFHNPVLVKISLDVEDEIPNVRKSTDLGSEGRFQSRLTFNAANWRAGPETATADTPTVVLSISRRDKDARLTNPVTVHCSFVFTAQKDGRTSEKTMSFDLYLEKLENPKGKISSYPWKVKNVEYR